MQGPPAHDERCRREQDGTTASMRRVVLAIAFVLLASCPSQRDDGETTRDDAAARSPDAEDAEADGGEEPDGDAESEGALVARDDAAILEGCTSCHGGENAAPPVDLDGHNDTTFPGVGAHQTHLRGTPRARPVPCGECHVVPENVLDPGHLDSPRPAEVIFSGAAVAFATVPIYAGGTCQNTACHGGRGANQNASGAANPLPSWTKVDGTQAACGDCHGLPPPPPHPGGPLVCAGCHKDVAEDFTFLRPERHVDGLVTFTLPP